MREREREREREHQVGIKSEGGVIGHCSIEKESGCYGELEA